MRKAISESRMSAAGEGKSTLFGQARPTTPAGGFQLDHILECMDVSHISEWLQRTNETVEAMRAWWNTEDNAVTFQHFWLSEFDDKRRAELVELEGDLLQEELKLALRVGLESRQVRTLPFSASTLTHTPTARKPTHAHTQARTRAPFMLPPPAACRSVPETFSG